MNEIPINILPNVVSEIVSRMHPEKIVLFGSAAEGRTDAGDIDLMIVHDSDLRPDRRGIPFSRLFRPRACPMDFLVYTPSEAERFAQEPGSFYAKIMRTGKILYERAT